MKFCKEKLTKLLDDKYLAPYKNKIDGRAERAEKTETRLTGGKISLTDFANAHEYYGFHVENGEWVFREWAPHAKTMYIVGDFSNWEEWEEFSVPKTEVQSGIWEIKIPFEKIKHGQLYKLHIYWDEGNGERIPAYARRVVQNEETKIFSAQVWNP